MSHRLASDPREPSRLGDREVDVELPRDWLPLPLLLGLVAAIAVGLFLYLDANRNLRLDYPNTQAAPAKLQPPPPPLLIPPIPDVPPAPNLASAGSPQPLRMAIQPPPRQVGLGEAVLPRPTVPQTILTTRARGAEPALVVDLTTGITSSAGTGEPTDDAVRATTIRNRASIIPQGAIIAAVLETPLNSDRPGLARALISQDVRSFDGSRVLIPRGSRLIGEFKAEAGTGLSRVLVTWSRLIRPDGVAIRIGSPVTDALGGAGAPGRINSHFLERFGAAVLQSALTIGVNIASQLPTNGGSIYVGVPGQVAQVGQQILPNVSRAPTVKVPGGAQIAVLVARDLDFGGTPAVR